MLSLRAHTSVAAVTSYYKVADYYLCGDSRTRGLENSVAHWWGSGAKELGLRGAVQRGDFEQVLKGQLPSGDQLGTYRNGQLEHRPSWDLTFSAPKSVSIMALVGDDKRLLEAHDRAVCSALSHLESRIAETRIREHGRVSNVRTGNLVVASLREETSRSNEPQVHSHNIVMNATQTEDGRWRSVDGYAFFQAQRELGQIYRSELAIRCAELGYKISQGKGGTFELSMVPDAIVREFSTRSAQIEGRLAEKGLSRQTATSAQKDVAALGTRDRKSDASSQDLAVDWHRRCVEHAFEPRTLVNGGRREGFFTGRLSRNDAAAAIAVDSAIAKLAERDAVFSGKELRGAALEMSVGHARLEDVERAISRAVTSGQLISRGTEGNCGKDPSYTTEQGRDTEVRMLAAELGGRRMFEPMLETSLANQLVARQEASSRWGWTSDQRLATAEILSSKDQIMGVQGYAGTAKTTTVLRAVSKQAERQGIQVVGMAPTAAAAEALSDAIAQRAVTVSRHLSDAGRRSSLGREMWIVDEASMLSSKQTAELLESARGRGARVVLVGDVSQLGSVEAGAAFRQLQAAGMRTSKLEEIVRQSDENVRDSVYAAIRGDASAAIASIERSGGKVHEHADAEFRRNEMAKAFVGLTPDERRQTLLIDPSREGRESLTIVVREMLKREGTLTGRALIVGSYDSKQLTRSDARQVYNYEKGDRVRFRSDFASGVQRGRYYTVDSVNLGQRTVHLLADNGLKIAWQPEKWGSGAVEAYSVVNRELMAGDKIAWTKNDPSAGRINGRVASIISVNGDSTVTVADGRGSQKLDMSDSRNGHFRHAYVTTVHASQGLTADRVLVNAESFRTNLLSEKSFYVSISRARSDVQIFTDDRQQLIRAIEERTGEKATALRESEFSENRGNLERTALGEREPVTSAERGASERIAAEGQRSQAGAER